MFFCPYVYTIETRYNSLGKKIVYFITYIFAEFLLVGLQVLFSGAAQFNFNYGIKLIIVFFIALTSYVNIYELGYLWNDAETIKGELNPTLRLSNEHLSFYEKNKFLIYFVRILISVLLNLGLYYLISLKSFIYFSIAELLTLLIYILYNGIRNNFCHFLYFLLISIRYLSITLCYIEFFNFSVLISCLFIFPIIRTMEYKAHYIEGTVNLFFRKYIIHFDITKITSFRVLATLILLLISIVLKVFNLCNIMPVICCAYMFIYRFILFVAIKLGKEFKGYLKR